MAGIQNRNATRAMARHIWYATLSPIVADFQETLFHDAENDCRIIRIDVVYQIAQTGTAPDRTLQVGTLASAGQYLNFAMTTGAQGLVQSTLPTPAVPTPVLTLLNPQVTLPRGTSLRIGKDTAAACAGTTMRIGVAVWHLRLDRVPRP